MFTNSERGKYMHFDNDIDLYRVIGANIKQYREQAIIMVAHSLHFVPLMYVVAKCLNKLCKSAFFRMQTCII